MGIAGQTLAQSCTLSVCYFGPLWVEAFYNLRLRILPLFSLNYSVSVYARGGIFGPIVFELKHLSKKGAVVLVRVLVVDVFVIVVEVCVVVVEVCVGVVLVSAVVVNVRVSVVRKAMENLESLDQS
jgi:hypothetical protein